MLSAYKTRTTVKYQLRSAPKQLDLRADKKCSQAQASISPQAIISPAQAPRISNNRCSRLVLACTKKPSGVEDVATNRDTEQLQTQTFTRSNKFKWDQILNSRHSISSINSSWRLSNSGSRCQRIRRRPVGQVASVEPQQQLKVSVSERGSPS